jgi:hypothetical protein
MSRTQNSQQIATFGMDPQQPVFGIKRQQSLPILPRKRKPRDSQGLNNSIPMPNNQQTQLLRGTSDTAGKMTPEPAVTESEIAVFEGWLKNYPSIPVPSDAHFEALAILTGLGIEMVKTWFDQKLRRGRTPDLSATASSRTMSSKSSLGNSLGLSYSPRLQASSRNQILQEAALWVRDHKGVRCTAVDDSTLLARDDNRPFQCTFKCGRTFDRKDDWRKHEEINYPQEGWLCDVSSVEFRAGVPICTFCGVENPEMNHMQKHSRKTPCHDKHFKDLGRISYRKDKIRQHFKNAHPNLPYDEEDDSGHFLVESKFPRSCGFCSYRFVDWKDRINHIGDHFASHTGAQDMTQWREPFQDKHSKDDDDDDDYDDDYNDGDDDDQDRFTAKEREETGITRKLVACIRCRQQRIRVGGHLFQRLLTNLSISVTLIMTTLMGPAKPA